MAASGRGPRRRSWIRRRHGGSKLSGHGGEKEDISVKPGSRSFGDWICVGRHRIRRGARMRVDANGNVYVPDSEDEESGMEVGASGVDVADLGAATVAADGVQMAMVGVPADAIAVGSDGFVATEDIPAGAIKIASEGGTADGVKVAADVATGEEMHPEVASRLKMLLAHMDPTFHDVFVSIYKTQLIAQRTYLCCQQ